MSCSVKTRHDQKQFLDFFQKKEFPKALEVLDHSSLTEKEQRLLYLMEKGSLYYYQNLFFDAAMIFNEANELVDSLYTKSVKEIIASSIINENSKTFFGSIYERSLLYYYGAMSFYRLSNLTSFEKEVEKEGKKVKEKVELTESDKKANINKSRSFLIAWDSFFQEIGRSNKNKSIQQYDLLAKLMAGKLHLAYKTKRDDDIALQLFKDAYMILNEISPTYKSFNENFKDYNLKYRDYLKSETKKPSTKEIAETDYFLQTKKDIQENIYYLTNKYRKNELREVRKNYLKGFDSKNYKTTNIEIVIENGYVSPLKPKDIAINLKTAVESIENKNTRAVVEGIGIPVLTYFALGPLGLGAVSHGRNYSIYTSHNVGTSLTKEVGIEFEVPHVDEPKSLNSMEIQFYQNEKLIKTIKPYIAGAVSDYAFISNQENLENTFSKRAARVGGKYILAIIAAYNTYNTMNKNGGELFAKPAAFGQFLVSQKAIKESEKADSRHWSTLPSNILGASLNLSEGSYKAKLIEYAGDKTSIVRSVDLGEFQVNDSSQSLFSFRAL